MIGQNKILQWVDSNINSFPHFIVLVGLSGSGKKTIAREISHKISCIYSLCDIKVDTVREVIDTAYQSNEKIMYCFADADNMRPQAKNALLKITEEPPKNAYFCLTVTDDSSLLDTIKSRAIVFYMQEYTIPQLKEYYHSMYGVEEPSTEEVNLFCEIATTPGDIDKLTEYGKDFYDYVELVVDNIAEVDPANAFKSSSKLALKSDEGYDLRLFFSVVMYVFEQRINSRQIYSTPPGYTKYCTGLITTSRYFNMVGRLGVNKQQLYDRWVFDIRRDLM